MAGRKPIGDRAMTNAERQKHWRKRHRPSTPSEKFRHKLYFLIRFFANWLSEDEIRETLEAFGMAWSLNDYVATKGEVGDYMERVYFGEEINGNPDAQLGDEDRYRREREERRRRDQEAAEESKRRWESLLKKHNEDRKRAAGDMIAGIAA